MSQPTCRTCVHLRTHDKQLSSRQWAVWHECGNASIPQRGRIFPDAFYCAQHTPTPTPEGQGDE